MTSNPRIVLTAGFTALPGRADEVDALIRGLAAEVRKEPGNLVFDVYRERRHPDRFLVFEVYADADAFDAHLGAGHGADFNAALEPLIVEEGSRLTFLDTVDASRPQASAPSCFPADSASASRTDST